MIQSQHRPPARRLAPRLVVGLALVMLVALGSAGSALAQGAGSTAGSPGGAAHNAPRLTDVAPMPGAPDTIVLSGQGFTPGGRVYVAIYDQMGAHLYPTRWIAASAAAYGPDGSTDPALGYRPGGTLHEVFTHLCGATAMVRAYDESTVTWSNWMNFEVNCNDPNVVVPVSTTP